MRLERLCTMDLRYVGDFDLIRPYGNEAGLGYGGGVGTVEGDRLAGSIRWSNDPVRRGDGVMLPDTRGVITTADGARVLVDLTGRTVSVGSGGETAGRQLLMTLLTAEDETYAWLNNTVAMAEGAVDPEKMQAHLVVHLCHSDLVT